MKLSLASLLLIGASARRDDSEYYKKGELRKVVYLARHGNRTPNAPILELCPAYEKTLKSFGPRLSYGTLTTVGMSEMFEAGALTQKLYSSRGKGFRKSFLPDEYSYDKTFFFQSERADRNLVSTQAFLHGLFPAKSGPVGFLKDRPTMVPIQSTAEGHDDMFNNPRDGGCIPRNVLEAKRSSKLLLARMTADEETLMRRLSAACDGPALENIAKLSSNKYNTGSAAKIIMDALIFARTEGLDATLGGALTPAEVLQLRQTGHEWMMRSLFNSPERVTQWAGDFPSTLLRLFDVRGDYLPDDKTVAKPPGKKEKFAFFLAHRELIYALLAMFDLQLALAHVPEGYVPAGSHMAFEVYDYMTPRVVNDQMQHHDYNVTASLHEALASNNGTLPAITVDPVSGEPAEDIHVGIGVDVFFWRPSGVEAAGPDADLEAAKRDILKNLGERVRLTLPRCQGSKVCPLSSWARAYDEWIQKTGTWQQLCSPEAIEKFSQERI